MTAPDNDDPLAILREAAQSRRRHLDHTLARQAEVNAKPDAQPWEVEHARTTVVEATAAVERHAVALAMATGSGS